MPNYVTQMSKDGGSPYKVMDEEARTQVAEVSAQTGSNTQKLNKLIARSLQSNTDLNNVIEYGWYLMTNPTHAPSQFGDRTIYLEVLNFNDGTNYVLQRAYCGAEIDQPSYIRLRFNSTAWTDWKKEGNDKDTDNPVLSAFDLDTKTEEGTYLTTAFTNGPIASTSAVITNTKAANNWVLQELYVLGDYQHKYCRMNRGSGNRGAWDTKTVLTSFDLNTKTDEGSFITTAFTNGPIDSTTSIITNTKVAEGWVLQELEVFGEYRKRYYRMNRGAGNYGTWYNDSTGYNYFCVNFGDSIYGNNRGNTSISYKLSALTGWKVFNGGAGGCRMSATAGNNYQRFSMVELADAVVAGDFSAQATAAQSMGSYYGDLAAGLAAIDWDDVDRITISYGTNDWSADVQIGSDDISDETKTTFKGALRYALHKLSTAYPKAKIAVCGLFNRFDLSTTGTPDGSEWENTNGDTVVDFCKAAEEVAKQYAVQYIDQFYIGVNKYNYVPYHYENDGTHLNSFGCDLAALNLYKKLV